MSIPSQSSSNDSDNSSSSTSRSWWRWRWRSVPVSVIGDTPPSPSIAPPIVITEGRREEKAPIDKMEMSGWDRIKEIYEKPSMERDLVQRVARMTFFAGFVVGGANGYLLAKQQYEIANKGRKYLSPSDAVKRRIDYAIVRFAMKGFKSGIMCGLISGSVVLLSTHTAAVRRHFSSLYFPAFSGPMAVLLHSVCGVFAFPTGIIGTAQALGLGISSGLTLSAVCGLYALSTDRSIDSAYWHMKREYEAELKEDGIFEKRVLEVMDERKVWRYEAVKIVKEEDDMKLKKMDA